MACMRMLIIKRGKSTEEKRKCSAAILCSLSRARSEKTIKKMCCNTENPTRRNTGLKKNKSCTHTHIDTHAHRPASNDATRRRSRTRIKTPATEHRRRVHPLEKSVGMMMTSIQSRFSLSFLLFQSRQTRFFVDGD